MVCGKQHFLASKRPEPHLELGTVIELELPLERFWALEKLLERHQQMIAAGDNPVDLQNSLKGIYKVVMPYSVDEKYRIWFMDKISEL